MFLVSRRERNQPVYLPMIAISATRTSSSKITGLESTPQKSPEYLSSSRRSTPPDTSRIGISLVDALAFIAWAIPTPFIPPPLFKSVTTSAGRTLSTIRSVLSASRLKDKFHQPARAKTMLYTSRISSTSSEKRMPLKRAFFLWRLNHIANLCPSAHIEATSCFSKHSAASDLMTTSSSCLKIRKSTSSARLRAGSSKRSLEATSLNA